MTQPVLQQYSFTLPIPTKSAANAREHHMARHTRAKRERKDAKDKAPRWPFRPLIEIELVRVGRGGLDKGDNLPMALKSVRDGLADWLGFSDDDSPILEWKYNQRREEVDFYVEVTIRMLQPEKSAPPPPRHVAPRPAAAERPKSLAELAQPAYQAPPGKVRPPG